MPVEKLHPTFTFTEDRLRELQAVVPEAFADGQVNWATLREALGAYLEDEGPGTEHFGLFWPGKRQARRLAAQPSKGTLRPAPGEGVNEATTRNLFIEGDNLEVLKLLQKSYSGRVKLIYIDPPYNTGNDFVYKDDFREPLDEYLKRTGQADAEGLLTSNPKAGGRFHSNWLNMMLPRLMLARTLLSEDGVIFVSIDDTEVANLKQITNEIFGEENFLACILWQKKYAVSNDDDGVGKMHDFILCYRKSIEFTRNLLPRTEKQLERYKNLDNDPRGNWSSDNYISNKSKKERPTLYYPIIHPKTNEEIWPNENAVWRYSKENHNLMVAENRLYWGPDFSYKIPRIKRFISEIQDGLVPTTWWDFKEVGHNDEAQKETFELIGRKVFSTPKPVRLIKKIIKISTNLNENHIVLDFFSGSCTTAHAVLELNREEDSGNRRFIMVQMPESTPKDSEARTAGYQTIAEIGKERIRRVIKKLADSPQAELIAKRDTPEDLGFAVYKLDRSHFKAWQDYDGPPDPAALDDLFSRFETPLVDGWQPRALLDEVLLQQGFPLDSRRTRRKDYPSNAVVQIDCEWFSFRLFVCLDDTLRADTIAALRLDPDDKFVCLDSALTDQTKQQLADRCTLVVI